MGLPEQIPNRFRKDAIFLPWFVDGEGAWAQDEAVALLESLKGTTLAVSDVSPYHRAAHAWAAAPPDVEWMCSETVWSVHRKHNESDIDYARRSRLEAAEFIRGAEVGDADVLFALTFPMFKDAA